MKLFKKVLLALILIATNLPILCQDLDINETVEYINRKLENCPCKFISEGYAQLKIGVTYDGYLTLREVAYSRYQTTRDFGNKYIKVRPSSLNFNRIDLIKHNSQNVFVEIPCKGEPSYKPGDCITEKNMTNNKIHYYNTYKICFTADQETQIGILNAFKHLGKLFSEDSRFLPKKNDPFLNYDQNEKSSNQTEKITLTNKTGIPDKVISTETIYSLNKGSTTNNVNENSTIIYGIPTSFPRGSYFKIKNKSDGNYYVQSVIGGQFAYGHYFKYVSKLGAMYKYQRTDGEEIEFLLVNYPLSKLAHSNQYDESIRLELINYRTSFAMLFLF